MPLNTYSQQNKKGVVFLLFIGNFMWWILSTVVLITFLTTENNKLKIINRFTISEIDSLINVYDYLKEF